MHDRSGNTNLSSRADSISHEELSEDEILFFQTARWCSVYYIWMLMERQNFMRYTSLVFIHFKRTETSGQIYWGRKRDRKCLNFNANHLNERKDKERLLLEKILDVERETTHDRNYDNINIFCMWKIKSSTFTARDVKLNFRNKNSPDVSSISVWQNYSSCSHVY